jgi:cytochrome bd ubiquinol oxidase subunit II
MSLAAILAVVLGLSLTAYAIFAGADFGAGVIDLLAGERSSERAAIADTIGPVWEANHVWLVFSIILLFSAFPTAFAALGTALFAPLTIALVAIVLRGVALGLRASGDLQAPDGRRLSRLFGIASIGAPFLFGAVAGGVAEASSSGSPAASASPAVPWASLFALTTGALAVALCTELAASLMALRMGRAGRTELANRFRRRGLQSAVGTIALSALALGVASWKAPALSDRLLGPALPVIILGFAAAATSTRAFWVGSYRLARGATLLSAVAVIWGWILAQSPHLIGSLTVHRAAANGAALTAIAVAVGVTLVTVLPALFLLFGVFARPVPEETR